MPLGRSRGVPLLLSQRRSPRRTLAAAPAILLTLLATHTPATASFTPTRAAGSPVGMPPIEIPYWLTTPAEYGELIPDWLVFPEDHDLLWRIYPTPPRLTTDALPISVELLNVGDDRVFINAMPGGPQAEPWICQVPPHAASACGAIGGRPTLSVAVAPRVASLQAEAPGSSLVHHTKDPG